MKELLEVLRVQRHDFMNHLQIISGMVQLNKTDRIYDYIREIARKISEDGKITALVFPETAAALLVNRQQAVKQGVEVQFDITTNLAGCKSGGRPLAEIIGGLISIAVGETCGEKCIPGQVFVDIKEESAGFVLAVSFVCGCGEFEGPPEDLAKLCRESGAVLRYLRAEGDKVQLRVELPRE